MPGLKLWPLLALVAGAAAAPSAAAQQAGRDTGTIEADGTVVVPSFRLPPSAYLSDEARKALPRTPADPEAAMRGLAPAQVGVLRGRMPQIMAPRLAKLRQGYRVNTRDGAIAGIPASFAVPAGGVAARNRGKIMLNLPGGGFVMGVASGGGMIESIPLAGHAGVDVVSIS